MRMKTIVYYEAGAAIPMTLEEAKETTKDIEIGLIKNQMRHFLPNNLTEKAKEVIGRVKHLQYIDLSQSEISYIDAIRIQANFKNIKSRLYGRWHNKVHK